MGKIIKKTENFILEYRGRNTNVDKDIYAILTKDGNVVYEWLGGTQQDWIALLLDYETKYQAKHQISKKSLDTDTSIGYDLEKPKANRRIIIKETENYILRYLGKHIGSRKDVYAICTKSGDVVYTQLEGTQKEWLTQLLKYEANYQEKNNKTKYSDHGTSGIANSETWGYGDAHDRY